MSLLDGALERMDSTRTVVLQAYMEGSSVHLTEDGTTRKRNLVGIGRATWQNMKLEGLK